MELTTLDLKREEYITLLRQGMYHSNNDVMGQLQTLLRVANMDTINIRMSVTNFIRDINYRKWDNRFHCVDAEFNTLRQLI